MSLMLFISTKTTFNINENYTIYTQLGNDNNTIFPHKMYIYYIAT